jgi:ABC-type branched-subunit amino acid transport system ATPase component
MLSLRDVHVHIGKLHILQGVNLEINSGESAALLGRNGVGKTTTLRAIMGLQHVQRGRVHLDGVDLTRLPPHKRAALRIRLVPQEQVVYLG